MTDKKKEPAGKPPATEAAPAERHPLDDVHVALSDLTTAAGRLTLSAHDRERVVRAIEQARGTINSLESLAGVR